MDQPAKKYHVKIFYHRQQNMFWDVFDSRYKIKEASFSYLSHHTVFRNIFQTNIINLPDMLQCSCIMTEVSTYSWFASSLNQIKSPQHGLQYTHKWFENIFLCVPCHSSVLKEIYMCVFSAYTFCFAKR